MLPIIHKGLVKGIAHITGGGLVENIPRILPEDVQVVLDLNKWRIPSIFAWLYKMGILSYFQIVL